ncbi:MAG: hypothetical protein KDA87_00650 [Planctomycetales bacterium]|nr:hypothetical protein [Planctomycetales bacterium]
MPNKNTVNAEQRRFRADPLVLKRLRVAAGLTVKEFTEIAGLDRATVAKMLRGDPVFLSSLTTAAKSVFNMDDVTPLLHIDELANLGIRLEPPSNQVLEWEIEAYLSGWNHTTNGLQYQLVQLRHRFLPDRLARAKVFELRHMSQFEVQRVDNHLRRHVQACDLIGQHRNLSTNLTAAFVVGNWWVIDTWEAGQTLADRLNVEPLSDYELRVLMVGLAEGIAAAHKAGVVLRELSPQRIIVRDSDGTPVITDMELAKISGGSPTVSTGQWPTNPYQALEVDSNSPVDHRADIYSWARILVHAATGQLDEPGREDVNKVDVPDVVRDIVQQSLRIQRNQRPDDMQAILRVLRRWF